MSYTTNENGICKPHPYNFFRFWVKLIKQLDVRSICNTSTLAKSSQNSKNSKSKSKKIAPLAKSNKDKNKLAISSKSTKSTKTVSTTKNKTAKPKIAPKKATEKPKTEVKKTVAKSSSKAKAVIKKTTAAIKSKTPIKKTTSKPAPKAKVVAKKAVSSTKFKVSVKKASEVKKTPAKKVVAKAKVKSEKKVPTKKIEKKVEKKQNLKIAEAPKKPIKAVTQKAGQNKIKKVEKIQKIEKENIKKVKDEPVKKLTKKEEALSLTKVLKKKSKQIEEETEDPAEDLFLDTAETFDTDDTDLLEGVGLIESPIKRRPGRPPKNREMGAASASTIKFPSTNIRLVKKEPTKPRKPLSDTLPGTSLASLLISSGTVNEDIKKTKSYKNKHSDEILMPTVIDGLPEDDETQTKPSWVPRNWVTREGERLIIRGNELHREEQYGTIQAENSLGVVTPDQVDDIIRKIRETNKKKPVQKK